MIHGNENSEQAPSDLTSIQSMNSTVMKKDTLINRSNEIPINKIQERN